MENQDEILKKERQAYKNKQKLIFSIFALVISVMVLFFSIAFLVIKLNQ